jgi:hypothetical protein
VNQTLRHFAEALSPLHIPLTPRGVLVALRVMTHSIHQLPRSSVEGTDPQLQVIPPLPDAIAPVVEARQRPPSIVGAVGA